MVILRLRNIFVTISKSQTTITWGPSNNDVITWNNPFIDEVFWLNFRRKKVRSFIT